jgi:hypothetical protein
MTIPYRVHDSETVYYFYFLAFQLFTLMVPDESYSRNAMYALNQIFT